MSIGSPSGTSAEETDRPSLSGRVEGQEPEDCAGLVVAGPDLQVWFVDETARRLLGLPPGAPPSGALDPSQPATSELRSLVRRCLRHRLEAIRSLPAGGAESSLDARVCPFALPDGGMAVAIILTDASREQRLKGECLGMLSRVAHDLRSPLTVVQGFIEAVLEQKTTPAERRRLLSLALDQTRLMGRMLSGLGETLEVLAGGPDLQLQDLDAGRCVREVLDAFSMQAARRGIRIEAAVPEGLPAVRADETAVKRVLMNLLDNALRQSGDGGVIRVEAGERPGSVAVGVIDSGPGIPAEMMERIWEPFVSLQQTSARLRRGGSGLGLASVRSLVSAMGGETWAVSEQGKGAEFWFTLPCSGASERS